MYDLFKDSLVDFSNLILKIDYKILSNTELSSNQKLILSLDYTLKSKKGFNQLLNTQIGELFNIHVNTVSKCRRSLVKEGYCTKKGIRYTITDKYKQLKFKDRRNVLLIGYIYNHKELSSGAKLLWGEYNSINQNDREYFASREYTATRLGCSKESISKWTKQLLDNGLIEYELRSGFASKQKVVSVIDIENLL